MKSSTHNQKADSGAVFRRLLRFMGPYRKGLTVSVICIILSSLFNSFGPFVLGRATAGSRFTARYADSSPY